MSDIYYQVYGQGFPLILLHGWGMSGEIWGPVLTKLSKKNSLYVVDLPGFGRSPFSDEPFSIAAIAKKILKIAPEKSHWLGWSLGGLIATYLASFAPERVSSVINVASTPRFVRTSLWPGIELPVLEKFAESLLGDFRATLQRFLALQVLGCEDRQGLLREIKQLLARSPQPSPLGLKAGLQLLIETDLRFEFAELSCPNLSILGNLDGLVPRALAPLLTDLNPTTHVIMVPGASHMPFLSHPDYFCHTVSEFIENNE